MTREEAIKELTELLPEEFLSEYTDAIKMGIEVLRQEPCGDCISRKSVSGCVSTMYYKGLGKQKSLEYILKYVERLPPVSPQPCEDCISREKALEALMDEWTEYDRELIGWLYDKIDKLPSVTVQMKMGRWISNADDDLKISEYTCSNCKGLSDEDSDFCPKCGSYNGGGDNGNE